MTGMSQISATSRRILEHEIDTGLLVIKNELRHIVHSERYQARYGPPNFPEVAKRDFERAVAYIKKNAATSWTIANDLARFES
jgi:hypothetical protein